MHVELTDLKEKVSQFEARLSAFGRYL